MTSLVNYFAVNLMLQVLSLRDLTLQLKNNLIKEFDKKLVRFDGWFLVVLATLLVISFIVTTALAVWCVTYKGKRFTGRWYWNLFRTSVMAECA